MIVEIKLNGVSWDICVFFNIFVVINRIKKLIKSFIVICLIWFIYVYFFIF